jgi:hypothetical protein
MIEVLKDLETQKTKEYVDKFLSLEVKELKYKENWNLVIFYEFRIHPPQKTHSPFY